VKAMNEQTKNIVPDGEWFSRLDLVEKLAAGRIRVRLTSEPVFRKSLLFVFCCGILCTTLQYLNVTDYFGSFRARILIDSVYFLILLPGAFYITGHFDSRKLILLFVSVVIFETYLIVTYGNHTLETPYWLLATWQIFYWTWTEPEVMEKLGVRKSKLITDALVAIVPSALIAVYTIIGMNAYGLKFEFHIWRFASEISTTFPMSLVIYIFIFTVWKNLQAKGPGLLGNIFILLSLISIISLPQFVFFYFIGKVNFFQALGGFITYSLISILLASLTFARFRNALVSAVILSVLQAILQGVGIT